MKEKNHGLANVMGLESFPTVYEAHGIHPPSSMNEENMNDAGPKVGPTPTGNTPCMSSYANVTSVPIRKALNFHTVFTLEGNKVNLVVLLESIRSISERFVNTAYGFFLGKRVAYPVVANYVRNTWGKYGQVKSILNLSVGIFSFQFSSMDDLDAVPENGPWDGLSAITTKLGTPLMFDSYTFNMYIQSWGRSSYARALIEVRGDVELNDNIVVAMPKLVGEGFHTYSDVVKNMKKPSQAPEVFRLVLSSTTTTHIVDKIEILIIDVKVTLVNDEGKPLEKGTYKNDDYDFDPYDDDMYEGQDIPDKIQAIYDNLNIKVRDFNSTLKNHISHPYCEALKRVAEPGQSSMSRDESLFMYNPDVLREQFTGLVIQQGLPFNHFDKKQTPRVFQKHLQPKYNHRVIAFKDFPSLHSGSALAKTLRNVFDSFNMENKIMPITLDNASNNTSAIGKLKLKYDPPMEERKQDKSTLETHVDFEEEILDAEVQANQAIPLSDEEIALDAASSEGARECKRKKCTPLGLDLEKNWRKKTKLELVTGIRELVTRSAQKVKKQADNLTEYSTAKELWDALGVWGDIDRTNPNPMKCSEDIKTYAKIRSDKKIFQFLNGLDQKFKPIKREILRFDPLPTTEAAYAIVRKEVAHQNILGATNNEPQGIATGLIARETKGVGFVTKGYRRNEGKKKWVTKDDKSHLKCEECGMSRRIREHCFRNDIRTGRILGRGTERDGLYYVDKVTTNGTVILTHGTSEREAWLWHRRMGHPSDQGEEQCDTLSWLRYTSEESCQNQNTTSSGAQEQSYLNINTTEDTIPNLIFEQGQTEESLRSDTPKKKPLEVLKEASSNVEQALKSEKWKNAMDVEMDVPMRKEHGTNVFFHKGRNL
uniref:Uncharacterized protein n=1 Tax=Tanacetum cinerariifolium TaxID=118510 RepID=A0A6L2KUS6_TANCI|nr:hypothetical protein [Tanacetum cinerariifolium]